MLKVSFIEFFFRGLPEAFIIAFAAYAFSHKKIEVNKCLIATVIIAFMGYVVRLLPIDFGVHTILNIFIFIVLCICFLKFDYIIAIKVSVTMFICQFLAEGINLFIIQAILGKDIATILENPMEKIFYTVPSTIILGSIVFIYYFILKKKNKLK